jgi:hypothetical protein
MSNLLNHLYIEDEFSIILQLVLKKDFVSLVEADLVSFAGLIESKMRFSLGPLEKY